MSIHTETVLIYINECEFKADCEFEYTAGEEPYITGLPENCHPGEPDEINPLKLDVHFDTKAEPKDMTFLLHFEGICEGIQAQLQEIIDESVQHE